LTVHSSWETEAPRSSRIRLSAVETTSVSSAAIRDPTPVSATTHLAVLFISASFGSLSYMQIRRIGQIHRMEARFEVLPTRDIDEHAAQLPQPARLTVTCSPVHGPDRAVEVAARLRELGHAVTVHVAARMVRDRAHLDSLLDGEADDLFVIGGDADEPVGEYASAGELLPLIAEHPRRPRRIGIAGYPEGHPLISDAELEATLREKAQLADYVVTQMCFDPDAVRGWVERHGELPVFVGMPGKVARRQLLKMSARIGVGPSMRYLRKQRGLRRLLSRRSTTDRLYEALAPLDVAGFQFFTFNELVETWEWWERTGKESGHVSRQPSGAAGGVGQHGRAAA
jgi:methylenetetrahydrofolate reductase (NADPH)